MTPEPAASVLSGTQPLPHTRALCPTCQESDFEPLDDGEFPAVRCARCRLGMELRLSADPVTPYTRASYDAAREHGRGTPAWVRFHHDTAVAEDRLRQLATHDALPAAPTLKLWLDVGCSTGAFLAQARRRGWQVGGVELDEAFCHEVSTVTGLSVLPYREWMRVAMTTKAAVVSLFDVLEHLYDPVHTVRVALDGLQPGGVLVVEAPDLDACPTPEAFRAWRHRRVGPGFTEHLWYFSRPALDALFAAYGGRGRCRACYSPLSGRITYVWEKAGA